MPNDFPLSYFPHQMQSIILEVCETNRFHKDFLACSILTTAATAIGNTYALKITDSWKERCNLFIAIVGTPGVNKSAPLTWALDPIEKKERQIYKQYLKILEAFEADPENKGKNPPGLIKTIVSDATPEAVVQQLHKNERGILIYNDELSGFINSFQRYNKGNDEQFYLSVWSSKPVVVDRKTSVSIRINHPMLNIVGTIQPSVLSRSFEGKEDNGFFDRWLICSPNDVTKEYWSDLTLEPSTKSEYDYYINKLLDMSLEYNSFGDLDSYEVKYSSEAFNRLKKWQKNNTDQINSTDIDSIKAIRSKIETYIHRFSLIKHLLDFCCSDRAYPELYIEEDNILESIGLAEYFIENAILMRSADPSEKLQGIFKDLYNKIPGPDIQFTTREFIYIASSLGINERTSKRWIDHNSIPKGKLLTKIKHGTYVKN
jgi:hypothetical protein